MGDYAPAALLKLGKKCDKELPTCRFSGVLGDRNHTYGYHRGRNVLPEIDYSVRLQLDKLGPAGAASAIDLSFSAAYMRIMTDRLRRSALDPNDDRLECVREFYGTLNGRTVFGLMKDSKTGKWYSSTADNSHLTHIHISIFRAFCNTYAEVRKIFDVLAGVPLASSTLGEEVIALRDALKALVTAIPFAKTGPGGRHTKKGKGAVSIKTELDYIWEDIEKLNSKVDEILVILKEGK